MSDGYNRLVEQTLEDIKNDIRDMKEDVGEIKVQTIKTNGRVHNLEYNQKSMAKNIGSLKAWKSAVDKKLTKKKIPLQALGEKTIYIILGLVIIILALLGLITDNPIDWWRDG